MRVEGRRRPKKRWVEARGREGKRGNKKPAIDLRLDPKKKRSPAPLHNPLESPKIAEGITATMVELSQYQASEGIFTKAHVQLAAKTMAPAAWWATFGKAMPLLSAVARQVLAQPVCASSAERCREQLRLS